MAGTHEIAEDAGVHPELASRFVDAIAARLERGDRVILRGFGSLSVKVRPARVYDTPMTSDGPVERPATHTVRFKPADNLLSRVNKKLGKPEEG